MRRFFPVLPLPSQADILSAVDSYGTFTELALGSVLSQLASIATYPSASSSLLSLLRLLSYRIQRLRSVASNGEISTTPMETLVACHLAFRQSLPPQGSPHSESLSCGDRC